MFLLYNIQQVFDQYGSQLARNPFTLHDFYYRFAYISMPKFFIQQGLD